LNGFVSYYDFLASIRQKQSKKEASQAKIYFIMTIFYLKTSKILHLISQASGGLTMSLQSRHVAIERLPFSRLPVGKDGKRFRKSPFGRFSSRPMLHQVSTNDSISTSSEINLPKSFIYPACRVVYRPKRKVKVIQDVLKPKSHFSKIQTPLLNLNDDQIDSSSSRLPYGKDGKTGRLIAPTLFSAESKERAVVILEKNLRKDNLFYLQTDRNTFKESKNFSFESGMISLLPAYGLPTETGSAGSKKEAKEIDKAQKAWN
jgi:hypothetical protein